MRRALLLGAVALVAVVAALAAWVLVPSALDLAAARRVVSTSPQRLEESDVRSAQKRLDRAADRLDSAPARVLTLVPALGPNVTALQSVASGTIPVLDAGLELQDRTEFLTDELLVDGAVDFGVLARLEEPLEKEAKALTRLEATLQEHRSGWLMPSLWSRMEEYSRRVAALRRSAEAARGVLAVAPAMLGADGPRTYLVALLNNAELRGAGGILSGIGTITARDGRLDAGSFAYYQDLADEPPYRRVPAPKDFREHFGIYEADTTRWVAASSSPDVPDVAIVARRLYELTAGVEVDGVIFADPRGIAALMPPSARIEVPRTEVVLAPPDVPRFVYKTAYEKLGGPTESRRGGLIHVGHEAFSEALKQGLNSGKALVRAADATAGGHLRVVSFDPRERRALTQAGVTGNVGHPERDGALVTVQNYGGNKLDYYARRRVEHECRVDRDGGALCATQTVIANHTPLGLTRYQYQYKPLGLFKNFVEVYLPRAAEVTAVEVDGRPARFYPEREDGYRAIGVYLRIPRNTRTRVTVGYRLPPGDGYSLALIPQPLTHDADARVHLDVPAGWVVEGPDLSWSLGSMTYRGKLDRPLSFEASPSDRTGIPALWAALRRFWTHPIF